MGRRPPRLAEVVAESSSNKGKYKNMSIYGDFLGIFVVDGCEQGVRKYRYSINEWHDRI